LSIFLLFFILRFGEITIANAKNNAETITIDAPIGKSETRDK
jgi:hypothetical protein